MEVKEFKNLVSTILNKFKVLIVFASLLLVASCSSNHADEPFNGQAFVVSVSSDGDYIVSSGGKKIILWDIKNKTKKTISNNANIYSAYFIKNSHLFMWQDLNDIVHVQSIDGKEILNFHNFPTYGHVITSDLKYYFASDEDWNLYSGYEKNQKIIKKAYDGYGFIGAGKLLNLALSNNEKLLLTSGISGDTYDNIPITLADNTRTASKNGYDIGIVNFSLFDGLVLWNVTNGQPLYKLPGNDVMTIATISPDDKYVVSGDNSTRIFVWDTISGKKELALFANLYGTTICKDILKSNGQCYTDMSGYPSIPWLMFDSNGERGGAVFSLKFIDNNNHYLRFTTNIPYATLYNIHNPKPLKYFSLGRYPFPAIVDYSRDEAIDTAPAANILVMAQQDGPGIIVYKFDPKTLTLKKIWAPGADNWHLFKIALINLVIGGILTFLLLTKSHRWKPYLINCAIILLIIAAVSFFYFDEWGMTAGNITFAVGIIGMSLWCAPKLNKK